MRRLGNVGWLGGGSVGCVLVNPADELYSQSSLGVLCHLDSAEHKSQVASL